VHVISRKALKAFAQQHPAAAVPLDDWYQIAKRAGWKTIMDVKKGLSACRCGGQNDCFQYRREQIPARGGDQLPP
jgi:mRNA-degrading endonuclease HigB of HigAB toxin-antitoxin module